MKKIIPILLAGILFTNCVSVLGLNNRSDAANLCINAIFSKPTIEQKDFDKNNYIQIKIDDSIGTIHQVGKPLLPVQVETFELPFGTKIVDVNLEIEKGQTLFLSHKILPCSNPLTNSKETVFTMDETIYQSDDYFPNNWYKISTGGGLNDANQQKTFINVQVFPIRYNPVRDRIDYASKIHLNIEYKIPKKPLLSANDDFDMVVIAPSKFSESVQPLIEHKNSHGVKTFLKTTEEIYNEYDGFDKPEKIKYFIKDAKETYNITYVLLMGGLKSYLYGNPRDDVNQGSKHWHVPVRYTNTVEPGTFNDPGFLSDLYFMDIYDGEGNFSSWDSNGDGIYALWKQFGGKKDIIDFYPDVYVGRLACRNVLEVKIVVNKIINYENKPIDSSWFKRMVVVAGDGFDDSPYGTNWCEDEMICDKFLTYMKDFESVKLYGSNKENNSKYTPLTSNILRELNAGCGFIVFAGHGCPYQWNTNWPGEFNGPIENGGISTSDFLRIRNRRKLPICCIEGGCHNSMFNVSLITTFLDRDNSHHLMTYGKPTPECLGWTFVRKWGGGSIANFGYPSSTYCSPGEKGDLDGDGNNEPDILEIWRPYMVRQYYNLIGGGTEFLGDVAGGAVRNYLLTFPDVNSVYDAKIIEQVIFFGDPSLKIGGYL